MGALGLFPLLILGAVSAQADDGASEYQVKAAFLLNFTRFVEWPAGTFRTSEDPMVICISGRDPFGGELDRIVSGKTIDKRPLMIRRISEPSAFRSCHVAFFTAAADRLSSEVSIVLGNPNILLVGESGDFSRRGGMINFVVVDSHVRFEANPSAATRAGLKISSKLLQLAIIVGDK